VAAAVPMTRNGRVWANAEALTLRSRQPGDAFTDYPVPIARRQEADQNLLIMLNADFSNTFFTFVMFNGDGSGSPLGTGPKASDRIVDASNVQYEVMHVKTPNPFTFVATVQKDR
jgi:hypothetical protein